MIGELLMLMLRFDSFSTAPHFLPPVLCQCSTSDDEIPWQGAEETVGTLRSWRRACRRYNARLR